ncbi:MerR family transcriptional regulator [Deinococcus irradiatisoli]|uniref:MerR family transcriptional regulator n=1 Tax=Deinococcus irradiatisoli TaxID=2202254 RepID=A0A2Z3JQ21_9DEIO|nr:MerR family transcriptional regulator [Deinococcus irradiatisoli]AWN23558.1 MerR family transcriptional regulator [Deinococcus irradiatisoli]
MEKHGTLKIGELARATGLTIRTLRHYDAVGLLSPRQRTESEHRLYSQHEVVRLLHIQSLKALGLSLGDIRAVLDDPAQSPQAILERHMAFVQERIKEQQALLARLKQLGDVQRASGAQLLEVIKMTQDIKNKVDGMMDVARSVGDREEDKFSGEQMQYLKERAEQIGQERIEEVQNAWPELMAAVLIEMERGTDPHSPQVRALAQRWQALVSEFTGGRSDIKANLNDAYARRMTPEMQAMWDYISQAMK